MVDDSGSSPTKSAGTKFLDGVRPNEPYRADSPRPEHTAPSVPDHADSGRGHLVLSAELAEGVDEPLPRHRRCGDEWT